MKSFLPLRSCLFLAILALQVTFTSSLGVVPSLSPLQFITIPSIASFVWENAQNAVWGALLPIDQEDAVAIFISEGVSGFLGGVAGKAIATIDGNKNEKDSSLVSAGTSGAYFGVSGAVRSLANIAGLSSLSVSLLAFSLAAGFSEIFKLRSRSIEIQRARVANGPTMYDLMRFKEPSMREMMRFYREGSATTTPRMPMLGQMTQTEVIADAVRWFIIYLFLPARVNDVGTTLENATIIGFIAGIIYQLVRERRDQELELLSVSVRTGVEPPFMAFESPENNSTSTSSRMEFSFPVVFGSTVVASEASVTAASSTSSSSSSTSSSSSSTSSSSPAAASAASAATTTTRVAASTNTQQQTTTAGRSRGMIVGTSSTTSNIKKQSSSSSSQQSQPSTTQALPAAATVPGGAGGPPRLQKIVNQYYILRTGTTRKPPRVRIIINQDRGPRPPLQSATGRGRDDWLRKTLTRGKTNTQQLQKSSVKYLTGGVTDGDGVSVDMTMMAEIKTPLADKILLRLSRKFGDKNAMALLEKRKKRVFVPKGIKSMAAFDDYGDISSSSSTPDYGIDYSSSDRDINNNVVAASAAMPMSNMKLLPLSQLGLILRKGDGDLVKAAEKSKNRPDFLVTRLSRAGLEGAAQLLTYQAARTYVREVSPYFKDISALTGAAAGSGINLQSLSLAADHGSTAVGTAVGTVVGVASGGGGGVNDAIATVLHNMIALADSILLVGSAAVTTATASVPPIEIF